MATGTAGIELEGLSKAYRSVQAVRRVDLRVEPGETVAILGPNGAGKSTTIDMILGLTRPDTGRVTVFGREPGAAVAAGDVGAMLQVGVVVRDLTVRELVRVMASLYPDPLDVDEALRVAGVGDVADRMTQKLSGGQTQRLRFAVALAANPRLLVLDEPTVAMDVEGRHAFWGAIRRFAASGRTVVFATHYLEEADAYADRIVLMAQGRVVADGPATQIRALVGSRTIRATLPDADDAALAALPGVTSAERRGGAIALVCADSDTALRALLHAYPQVSDIEVIGAGIEAAFMSLTGAVDDQLNTNASTGQGE